MKYIPFLFTIFLFNQLVCMELSQDNEKFVSFPKEIYYIIVKFLDFQSQHRMKRVSKSFNTDLSTNLKLDLNSLIDALFQYKSNQLIFKYLVDHVSEDQQNDLKIYFNEMDLQEAAYPTNNPLHINFKSKCVRIIKIYNANQVKFYLPYCRIKTYLNSLKESKDNTFAQNTLKSLCSFFEIDHNINNKNEKCIECLSQLTANNDQRAIDNLFIKAIEAKNFEAMVTLSQYIYHDSDLRKNCFNYAGTHKQRELLAQALPCKIFNKFLCDAINNDNIELVQSLIKIIIQSGEKRQINSFQNDKMYPLTLALSLESNEILTALNKIEIQFFFESLEDMKAIINQKIVERLINNDYKVDSTIHCFRDHQNYSTTLLCEATKNNDQPLVEYLLKNGATIDCKTLLASLEHTAILDLFLSQTNKSPVSIDKKKLCELPLILQLKRPSNAILEKLVQAKLLEEGDMKLIIEAIERENFISAVNNKDIALLEPILQNNPTIAEQFSYTDFTDKDIQKIALLLKYGASVFSFSPDLYEIILSDSGIDEDNIIFNLDQDIKNNLINIKNNSNSYYLLKCALSSQKNKLVDCLLKHDVFATIFNLESEYYSKLIDLADPVLIINLIKNQCSNFKYNDYKVKAFFEAVVINKNITIDNKREMITTILKSNPDKIKQKQLNNALVTNQENPIISTLLLNNGANILCGAVDLYSFITNGVTEKSILNSFKSHKEENKKNSNYKSNCLRLLQISLNDSKFILAKELLDCDVNVNILNEWIIINFIQQKNINALEFICEHGFTFSENKNYYKNNGVSDEFFKDAIDKQKINLVKTLLKFEKNFNNVSIRNYAKTLKNNRLINILSVGTIRQFTPTLLGGDFQYLGQKNIFIDTSNFGCKSITDLSKIAYF
ncbi:MAG TPA: hypothetical protein VLB80_03795 [Candidatus Babeliales bacterium]|nr:hypothetical protein [Candidatus Babeliales bacterium]